MARKYLTLEIECQGKRLHGLLRVGKLNAMRWAEFREMVAILEKLNANLKDFNVLHFGPQAPLARRKKGRGSSSEVMRAGTLKGHAG